MESAQGALTWTALRDGTLGVQETVNISSRQRCQRVSEGHPVTAWFLYCIKLW
jgi:hypothetical protein